MTQAFRPRISAIRFATLLALAAGASSPALAASGVFANYQAIPTGSWPEAVAVGDVNGDGLQDVVLTTGYYFDAANDYKLFVFLQQADGSLAPAVKYATAGSYTAMPGSVAVGDLNGDGLTDVVVGNDRSSIQVFLQTAEGTLGSPLSIATTRSTVVEVADLNGDGRDDIAGIGWGGSDVAVFLQDAAGGIGAAQLYAAPHGGYDSLALGDINSDGRTDIVVMSGQMYSYSNLAVLTQTAAGGFNPAQFHSVGNNELTRDVAIGDLNGDGRKDVVVSFGGNAPYSRIGVFAQNAAGTLDPVQIHTSSDIPESLLALDVDDNGLDDVVVLHGGWSRMGSYLQDAGGLSPEYTDPIPYASSYGPQGLAAGDINGDGSPDAVIADYNHGLVLLHNTIPFAPPVEEPPPPPPNQAPLAAAGSDRSVLQGSTVGLDGSASSDADGSIVSYQWRQTGGTAVTLQSSADGRSATFKAPKLSSRTKSLSLSFELTVTDDDGASSSDSVVITVTR